MSTYYSARLAKMLADLTDCLCAALANDGAGATCFCGVVPGDSPAWDYCGECSGGNCGMGFITVQSVFPYDGFPAQSEASKCDKPLAATLVVGALRCAPVPSEDGGLPDEVENLEATLGVLDDMGAIHMAIACCGFDLFQIGEWTPLGPAGGCTGGQWMVTVALDG